VPKEDTGGQAREIPIGLTTLTYESVDLAVRPISQNILPLWQPNLALSLGGQISPPAKMKC
jgi:hypothetical protein